MTVGRRRSTGFAAAADDDHRRFLDNLERAGVGDRVRHVRRFSDAAHGEVDGAIDVLFIDGAHRYRPARADIRDWGRRVAPGGVLLIHDSFSSIGVTLAIGRELLAGRRFRYIGRARSLAIYHADLDGSPRVEAVQRSSPAVGDAVVRPQRADQGAAHCAPRRRRPPPDRRGARMAVLTGWGSTAPVVADVEELAPTALQRVGERGALVRGLGRSYGDAAQNSGGLVLRLPSSTVEVVLDSASGTVTVPAGVSLGELLRVVVPHGFFVAVLPGTMHVTVGGAIASDIHGKNHHRDGSFGNSVVSLRLLLADGSVVELGPERRPDLFWATVGGMGLTGIVLDATLRLLPIETSRMSVDTTRIADLDSLMAAMADSDHRYRYSVAWIDLVAKGAHLGRSVLTNADHATLDQLGRRMAEAPLRYEPRQLVTVPPVIPASGLLNHASVAAFNELWFRKSPRRKVGQVQPIGVLLLPARPGRAMEPVLRPQRTAAVPVRRAVR